MRRFAPPLVLIALLVVGCSSSASKTTTTLAPATASGQSGGQSATTKPPSYSGSSSSHYCELGRQVESSSHINPTANLKTSFQNFDKVANEFVSVAPAQIKGDAQTLVAGVKRLETVLQAANYDYTKINPADLQSLSNPQLAAAATRIAAYDSQVCGISSTSPTT